MCGRRFSDFETSVDRDTSSFFMRGFRNGSSSEVSAYCRYLGMKLQRELILSLFLLLVTSLRKGLHDLMSSWRFPDTFSFFYPVLQIHQRRRSTVVTGQLQWEVSFICVYGFSGHAGEVLGGNGGGLQESLNGRKSCLLDDRVGVASLQGKL